MTYQITLEEKPSAEDRAIIGNGIAGHDRGKFPDRKITDVTFFVRDEAGAIVGGVAGNYNSFGWLWVDALWVRDDLRGLGYGRRLMEMIEAEAAKHGTTNAFLNTMSFQAPEFYKRLGYTVFAELEDFPPGHSRLFLRKKLSNCSDFFSG
jgi:N-acetylglutamate synthase-like GNAT family acetyltransferase